MTTTETSTAPRCQVPAGNGRSHEPETAGSLVTRQAPTVDLHDRVADVETLLINCATDYETINYIYVLNQEQQLVGVFSLKDLFRQERTTRVAEIMVREPVTVHADIDQEQVALLALRHGLKAVPVVNGDGRFLGVVPHHTLLRITRSEAIEDLLRMGGVFTPAVELDDVLNLSVATSFRHRLPWLLVGLVGGLLIAGIIGRFEATLQEHLVLAAFIPLVVYMAGAVGTQMEAFIIRDLAIHPGLPFVRYFLRQLTVVALIGAVLGVLLALYTGWTLGHPGMSAVLGVAVFSAIISSVFTGLVVPFGFSRLRLDPANASAPVATILQDLLSVTIYFSVAEVWL